MNQLSDLQKLLDDRYRAGAASRDEEVADLLRYKPLQSMVVVSRKWHEPVIRFQYTKDGIYIEMTPRDFSKAVMLALDVKPPPRPKWWRRLLMCPAAWDAMYRQECTKLESAVLSALEEVTHEMKLATIQSPPPIQKK